MSGTEGIPVVHGREEVNRRTPRSAAAPPAPAAATPPPDEPAPNVYRAPAALAQAWLNALCWCDFRGARTTYQAAPVTLTRTVNQDPDWRWLIGRPVTAN